MGSFMLPSNDRNLFQNINLPQLKTIISTAASVAATVVFVRTITSELVPGDIGEYFSSRLRSISKKLSSEFVVVIDEFNGIAPNQLFEAATVHLGSQVSPSIRRIKANKSDHDKELSFAIDEKEEFVDQFEGVKLKWTLLYTRINHPQQSRQSNNKHSTVWKSDLKYYELKFNMKHKEMVFRRYLPHLLQTAKSIKWRKKEIKLHTVDYNGTDYWSCVNLDHPATFDKIAMDPAQKKALIEDLDRFRNRRDYYKRVGKAWKRGYLLYGPPGTGKSSLIAAIANYSSFDVYDLDLKEVMCNSDLRRLLVGTASKSILVIEDIDCSMDLKNRENAEECAINDDKVTLSGLLNFTDGLWSSCGDERIIIFTTNHKDRLDPALLRPGRMDVHIEMSYCSFISFKILAATYLGIQEHPRYREIEELMDRVQATPADVAGELMKSDEVEAALQGLIEFMHAKSKNKGISD